MRNVGPRAETRWAEQDFEEQAAVSTPQRRDTRATASTDPEGLHPAPALQLPAEPFAAGRLQPSPNLRRKAASPPDRTSDREDCGALAWPPDPQMRRRIAEPLYWFEPHSSTGPAQVPDGAHVVAASDRSPASRSPSARHPHSVRCTEEHILMPAAKRSARGAERSRHRKRWKENPGWERSARFRQSSDGAVKSLYPARDRAGSCRAPVSSSATTPRAEEPWRQIAYPFRSPSGQIWTRPTDSSRGCSPGSLL